MIDIPEYKRDKTKDHLYVLKSLNEIPFNVGKNLLSDFLIGDVKNPSIEKNLLYNLHNFSKLEYLDKGLVLNLIQDLIKKEMIEESAAFFNRNIKTLSITRQGQQELISPTTLLVPNPPSCSIPVTDNEITDNDMKAFEELQGFLGNLNLEQKKAVVSSQARILCVAGAGTGKTTVLTKRIQFLNKMKKIRGDEILAITFTKKAKEEMQKRLEKLGTNDVSIETFNSFCEKILLKNTDKIYNREMRVAGYSEKMMGILRALEFMDITIDDAIEKYFSESQRNSKSKYQLQSTLMNDCFTVLDYYKSTGKNFEDITEKLQGKNRENAEMIYQIVKYLKVFLKTVGLRTYSDQITDTLNFFETNEENIPRYKYILVDEYQDVNAQQMKLISLLKPENLFCVGDPRQSIFGWRGSNIKFIINSIKDPLTEVITLKKNYRSSKHIVKLMNDSIKDMHMQDLDPIKSGEKFLKLSKFSTEEAEYEFISSKILLSKTERENIYILSRTNKKLTKLSEVLKKKGIAHIIKTEDMKIVNAKPGEVTLATIHAIKGLEAEEVFVMGCTNGNFPCRGIEHPIIEMIKMYDYNKEEEERRLFYVAISRAKSKLHLTYTGRTHTYFINNKMKEILDEVNY